MCREAKIHLGEPYLTPSRRSLGALFLMSLLCGVGALCQSPERSSHAVPANERISPQVGAPLARDPIVVYNDWSAYDELSDNIPLTEQLAMKELDEILRLRKLGVRFDYYMMDAFWFDPDGGYRTFGPGRVDDPQHSASHCDHRQHQPEGNDGAVGRVPGRGRRTRL